MSPSVEQIVAIYESSEGEISPEEIQEAMGGDISLAAIKMALMQGSVLYRKKAKENSDLFNDEDLELSSKVIRQLMLSADSDIVKLRCAMRVQDHKLGRLDTKNLKGINLSVTTINQEIAQAQKAIDLAKSKVTDIDPRHKHLMEITQ